MIGSVATPTCSPSRRSCSCAAGRRVSSEAISTFLLLPLGQALGDLGGGRRLARALQADHHDDDRGRGVEVDRHAFGAEHLDQLVMDDLDDHLAGLDRLQDLGADGLGAHLVGEGPHDVERHVGFEQRTAHLAQRRRDIGLRQRAAAGQAVQNRAKAFLKLSNILLPSIPDRFDPRGSASAPEQSKQSAKPKSTRGRIALPGVGLRDRFIPPFNWGPGRLLGVSTRRGICRA